MPTQPYAQIARGTISDRATGTPVAGAVIAIVRTIDGRAVGRALSDSVGRFSVGAPGAGTYALSAKRIGIKPMLVDIGPLSAGEARRIDLVVEGVVVPLDPLRVSAKTECGQAAQQSTGSTARLLEEVQAALHATTLSAKQRGTVFRFTRLLDPRSEQVQSESLTVTSGGIGRPFYSVRSESLATYGFVRESNDGRMTFYAPDAELLTSDWFLSTHCFQAVPHPSDSSLAGLMVRPQSGQRHPDVKGTMWLDRSSAELRHFEVSYTGLPAYADEGRAGTRIAFCRLANGQWIICNWVIRAPVIQVYSSRTTQFGALRVAPREADSVVAVQEDGGLVLTAEAGPRGSLGSIRGTLPPALVTERSDAIVVLLGTRRIAQVDSLGRFAFDSLVPGKYRVLALRDHSPSRAGGAAVGDLAVSGNQEGPLELRLRDNDDAIRILCPSMRDRRDRSALVLLLIDTATARALPGVPIRLRTAWQEKVSINGATLRSEVRDAHASLDGVVYLCDVPEGAIADVQLPGDAPSHWRPLGTVAPRSLNVRLLRSSARAIDATPIPAVSSGASGSIFGLIARPPSAGAPPGSPVSRVVLLSSGTEIQPDSCGHFSFVEVPAGEHRLRFRLTSGRSFDIRALLARGETLRLVVSPPLGYDDKPAVRIADTLMSCSGAP